MLTANLIIAAALLAAAAEDNPQQTSPTVARQQQTIKGKAKPKTHRPPSRAELAGAFAVQQYEYSGGKSGPRTYGYRLFVPRGLDRTAAERYPLLVWLHGAGVLGDDNRQQLKHLQLIIDDRADLKKYRFFVLATQWPDPRGDEDDEGPDNAGEEAPSGPAAKKRPADDMLAVTAEIARKTIADYPIDEDRVYLSGVSAGGSECWEMAIRYPELFAAVVPISSAGGDASRAETLSRIPIWAFHNLEDPAIPPDGDLRMVEAVKAAGGKAELTLLDGRTHGAWTAAFRKWDAMAWMLAQGRANRRVFWDAVRTSRSGRISAANTASNWAAAPSAIWHASSLPTSRRFIKRVSRLCAARWLHAAATSCTSTARVRRPVVSCWCAWTRSACRCWKAAESTPKAMIRSATCSAPSVATGGCRWPSFTTCGGP